ncbi:hypothetical protein [Microbulbifer hainanensis]|uniref:hypothetical protein n=1 Tax=Microbulbifer hainanensis TaxID=2735675 RepID=UPI001865CD9D|nr:hypothetical protein [Microbulbifer hainanensis]
MHQKSVLIPLIEQFSNKNPMIIRNYIAIKYAAPAIVSILVGLILPAISFASDWACYSPTTSDGSIVASSRNPESNKKITVGAYKFICFNETLAPQKINIVDYAAGVPSRFTRNPGEYVFSIDPEKFVQVQESTPDLLRGFKSIAFDLEDGSEWRILRQGNGYISNENQTLKAGSNEKLGLVYFFNLSKSDFNYTVLQRDDKHQCIWSEWPGIRSLSWEGWRVCDTPPRLQDKINRKDQVNGLPAAAQAWMATLPCADVSAYVIINIPQAELCDYTESCESFESPPDLHQSVFCKGQHRDDCDKESGRPWLRMSDIFAFDPEKVTAHNITYHFTKLDEGIYSKQCVDFQSLYSSSNQE